MRRIVVTRFSGPLGYSLSRHFRSKDVVVDGVDLFLTAGFEQAPVGSKPYQQWLDRQSPGFMHYEVDLLQRESVMELIREIRPSAIIHSLPLPPLGSTGNNAIDCDLILGGTRNLLEAARSFCWESPFIFLTNDAIYGDCMDTVVEEKRPDSTLQVHRTSTGSQRTFQLSHWPVRLSVRPPPRRMYSCRSTAAI